MMFASTTIKDVAFSPALFCAPMAGITHSAFRRLVSEFGGCGAFFTEMLSARQILHENLRLSPALRRRPSEKRLIYQLMVLERDPLDRIIGRLGEIAPDGIDINLACHAPHIRKLDTGSRLFENLPVLQKILSEARRCWPGLLTAKIRLGSNKIPGTEKRFEERLRAIEEAGVDAVILHPRYFEDKFKRRARHELFQWAASLTSLPLIANGDIVSASTIAENPGHFQYARGAMLGRIVAVQPWVFAAWQKTIDTDHAAVWRRLFDYTCEDFRPEQALVRMKIVSEYYARNFKFGHSFYVAIQNAPTLEKLRGAAERFFGLSPAIDPNPSVMGL